MFRHEVPVILSQACLHSGRSFWWRSVCRFPALPLLLWQVERYRAAESIRTTRLDPTLPLESIKRISKFLSDNGVITRDVSGEIAQHYTYEFLAKATGKSPEQLGIKQ